MADPEINSIEIIVELMALYSCILSITQRDDQLKGNNVQEIDFPYLKSVVKVRYFLRPLRVNSEAHGFQKVEKACTRTTQMLHQHG